MARVLGMEVNERRGGHYKYAEQVMRTYGGVCHLCSGKYADTIDHLIPFALHGSNHPNNLMPAHRSCNSSKGARYVSDGGLMTTDEGRLERGMMTEEEEREYREEQERIRLAKAAKQRAWLEEQRRKDIPYGGLRYSKRVVSGQVNWNWLALFLLSGINLALTIFFFLVGFRYAAVFIGLAIEAYILFHTPERVRVETKASIRNRAMDDMHNLNMLNQWAQREHNCTFEEYLCKKNINCSPEEWVQDVRHTRDKHGTWTYTPPLPRKSHRRRRW